MYVYCGLKMIKKNVQSYEPSTIAAVHGSLKLLREESDFFNSRNMLIPSSMILLYVMIAKGMY